MATGVTTNASRRVLVVPLIRVTPSLSLLSYDVPKGLEVIFGTCVRIPFRSKVIIGIVWAEDKTEVRKGTKAILGVNENLVLTQQQIALAQWLHVETLTSLNVILRSMVPGEIVDSPAQLHKQPKVTVVECPTNTLRQKVIAKWSQQMTVESKCTLVVVPNQGAVTQWVTALKTLQPLHIVPPRSLAAEKRLRKGLLATRTYITTHAGLLYPLPSVDRVILDLADDEAYFAFDQAPRVDVRALVMAFSRIHSATLLVLTRWVSPIILELFKTSKPTLIGLRPQITLIDRQNEPPGERGHLPPLYLLEKLQGIRTLWLHTRTSEAGRYVCFDCGTAILCPTCAKPLRVKSHSPLILECLNDNLRKTAPNACPVCKGTRLSTRGAGIQQVARTIADITHAEVVTLEHGKLEGDLNSAMHVVATTAIGSYPSQTFSAVVILQPDSYFSQPGFRSVEQFFSALALGRAAVSASGSIYVVTYKPENPAYTFLNNPNAWSTQALQERATLNYPPAGTLVILQPRKRIALPANQPFMEANIPQGVTKTLLGGAWLLRTTPALHELMLKWIQQALDPTWEAIVNPPSLPLD